MMKEAYVLGLDFGTDSVRALLLDAHSGEEVDSKVVYYPRWKTGAWCDPRSSRFRQHPLDHIEAFDLAVTTLLDAVPSARSGLRGIGVDTTGSSPMLVDDHVRPLGMLKEFADEPDALCVLWKDHTSIAEAEAITSLAKSWGGPDYTQYVGGVYSSEWFWAKVLHVCTTNPKIANAAASIVEHCDWIPALLCGQSSLAQLRRSRCAMGHKALWHKSFSPYPASDFLAKLHPRLAFFAESLGSQTWTNDQAAGHLSGEWKKKWGIEGDVVVAVGAFDAHLGAVGAGIDEGTFLRIMGTSTCDIMVAPLPAVGQKERLIEGICGQVDGSVLPGKLGLEAGQSAYGDVFAWFRRVLSFPLKDLAQSGLLSPGQLEKAEDAIIPRLELEARKLDPAGVIALDWFNGRRTPFADQSLKAGLQGLSLATDAPAIFRALVEAVAYGSRAITECFSSQGVKVERVVAIGGVAKKSKLAMQVLSDVLGMPIDVRASDQACARGAAICASVAAGIHPELELAMKKLASPTETRYEPNAKLKGIYDEAYARYKKLGSFVESTTGKGEGK